MQCLRFCISDVWKVQLSLNFPDFHYNTYIIFYQYIIRIEYFDRFDFKLCLVVCYVLTASPVTVA